MKPLVSVLMPCHNARPFIRASVDSVLAQSFRDFELICVDDGSTDGTADVLAGYGPSIRVLSHPGRANRGQTPSMNLAAGAAQGDLIALIDADDLWHPRKLEVQTAYLEREKDVAVVYTNGHAIDAGGRPLYELFRPNHREPSEPERLLMNCYISAGNSSVIIRRSALTEVGSWDESLQAQDHDMWLRLMEKFRFGYIPEFLMSYRKHGGQSSLRRRQWENGFVVLNRAVKRYPYRSSAVKVRRAVIHYRLASHDFRSRRFLAAAWHTAWSVFHHPSRAARTLVDITRRLVRRARRRGWSAALSGSILPD